MAAQMQGMGRLKRTLKRLPDQVEQSVQPALKRSAEELANVQRSLAPKDTGALANSIAVTTAGNTTPPYSLPGGSRQVGPNEVVVTAGNSEVRYAHLVEYGTSEADAQSFFWPAYRLLKKRLQGRITRAMAKAVKEGFAE